MKVYLKIFSVLIKKLSDAFKSQYPQELKHGSVLELDLPNESSISNLIDSLNLEVNNRFLIFVNGKSRKADYILSEGDQIGIFPPIGGG